MYNQNQSRAIYSLHYAQTLEQVNALRQKYETTTIFGRVKVSDLFLKLKNSYDITDRILFGTSQYDHALQAYEMMLQDEIKDEELLLAALIHDIGKVVDESPENLFCANRSVSTLPCANPKIEDIDFHFGHDEIAYIKLKAHCSPKVAFIIRYHSSRFSEEEAKVLRVSDKENFELLEQFLHYDLESKAPDHKPNLNEQDLIGFIDKHFPVPIDF